MGVKQTEALKLALEALENLQGLCTDADDGWVEAVTIWTPEAITAIREALAEQCVCGEPDTFGTHRTDGPCLAEQPAQQQQEPVCDKDPQGCWSVRCQLGKVCKNTSQQPSKPLTDEQIDEAIRNSADELLDHIYEYGTAAEGVMERIRSVARAAIESANGIKE